MDVLLPLFPLQVVLLPEELLPLHIFEERYKEMIGECLRAQTEDPERQEFGVVLAGDEGFENVGCTARTLKVVRELEDGRKDILTIGQRRFEVLFTDRDRAYLRGGVSFFDDDPGADRPAAAEARRAIELFRQALRRLHESQEVPAHFRPPYRRLSFQIGARLPLELEFKQRLLAMRDENERLGEVVHVMTSLIPRLEAAQKARSKAGGNGHVRVSGSVS